MKTVIVGLFLFLGLLAQANEEAKPSSVAPSLPPTLPPAVRQRPPNDANKESSSFIGDAENIDPLKARQENLKDDEEPVLEDIKQLLDAPPTASPTPAAPIEPSTDSQSPVSRQKTVQAKSKNKKKSAAKKIKKSTSKVSSTASYNDDDPDLKLEKTYHQVYQKFNQFPTSVEQWSVAARNRFSEVYQVIKGDTLWSISETLFGDPQFWPKIWALNRQGILNPHFITPGMPIHFYPGNAEDLPTLTVGSHADQEERDSAPEPQTNSIPLSVEPQGGQSSGSKVEPQLYTPPKRSKAVKKEWLETQSQPTAIPESFPLYQNLRYYGKPQPVEIQLGEEPKIENVYSKGMILTDKLVSSDVTISIEDQSKIKCSAGDIIKVKFKRPPVRDYAILAPSPSLQTKDGLVYAYRQVGDAVFVEDGKLRLKYCNTVYTSDYVFVPKEILSQLGTKKRTVSEPEIIGGPFVDEQNLFMIHQYVYLDLGSQFIEEDKIVYIKSQLTEKISGQIKLLQKFGSFGVGVITSLADSIQVGDRIVIQ